LTALCQQGLTRDLVIGLELERRLARTVLAQEMRQERGDVLRIHLAGVERNAGRRIARAENRDALVHDDLIGPGERAVAAALGGKIDDDRTRRHTIDHLLGHEDWRL